MLSLAVRTRTSSRATPRSKDVCFSASATILLFWNRREGHHTWRSLCTLDGSTHTYTFTQYLTLNQVKVPVGFPPVEKQMRRTVVPERRGTCWGGVSSHIFWGGSVVYGQIKSLNFGRTLSFWPDFAQNSHLLTPRINVLTCEKWQTKTLFCNTNKRAICLFKIHRCN